MNMATEENVKEYLAHWFQLGKKLLSEKGHQPILPKSIFQAGHYSPEFERCWQYVTTPENGDFYLEGMPQSLRDLLSSEWEVVTCSRCELPVPIRNSGNQCLTCPCHDLMDWPNTDLPKPRAAVNSTDRLGQIRDRLKQSQLAQQVCDRLWEDRTTDSP